VNSPLVPESAEVRAESAKRAQRMADGTTVWHGRPREAAILETLADNNCPTKGSTAIDTDPDSPCDAWGVSFACPVHGGILANQQVLDGLLMARRGYKRLIAQEMTV
jgi:hypothetical protein